jgi:hypothetical protein
MRTFIFILLLIGLSTGISSAGDVDTVAYTLQRTQTIQKLIYTTSTSLAGNSYNTSLFILDKKGLPFKLVSITNISQYKRVTIEIKNLQTGEEDDNYVVEYSDLSGCIFTDKKDTISMSGSHYTNLYIISFIDNTRTYLTAHFVQKIGEYTLLFDQVSNELIQRNIDTKNQLVLYQKLLKENQQKVNDSIAKAQEMNIALQRKLDEARKAKDSAIAAKSKSEERRGLYYNEYLPKSYDLTEREVASDLISNIFEKYVAKNEIKDCVIKTILTFFVDTNGHISNITIPQSYVDKLLKDDKEDDIFILRRLKGLFNNVTFPITKVNVKGEFFPVNAQFIYTLEFSISNFSEHFHFNKEDKLMSRNGDEISGELKEQFLEIYGQGHTFNISLKVNYYKLNLGSREIIHIREISHWDGHHTTVYNSDNTKGVIQSENVNEKSTPKSNEPIQATPVTPIAKPSVADELIKLKKLLDDGALNQQDFEAQKRKLLDN